MQTSNKPGASAINKTSVSVSDGTRLNVLQAGSGKTLVLIPGWSQTAEQFKFQIEGLADRYRVIAVDMRGHGDSDKPGHGYRIQRLAKDVHDVLAALELKDVTILGHSMGCSVLWCHHDLFGPQRIARYVFCDQASFLTTDPAWTPQQVADYGPIFTPESVTATAAALAGPDGVPTTAGFLKAMVTASMPADQFQWIVDLNLKMPRRRRPALQPLPPGLARRAAPHCRADPVHRRQGQPGTAQLRGVGGDSGSGRAVVDLQRERTGVALYVCREPGQVQFAAGWVHGLISTGAQRVAEVDCATRGSWRRCSLAPIPGTARRSASCCECCAVG